MQVIFLQNIYNSILLKDIVVRHSIGDVVIIDGFAGPNGFTVRAGKYKAGEIDFVQFLLEE